MTWCRMTTATANLAIHRKLRKVFVDVFVKIGNEFLLRSLLCPHPKPSSILPFYNTKTQ